MDKEILKTVREKGLLLEKEVFDLLEGFGNADVAKEFLEKLEKNSGQKLITRNVLDNNFEYVREFVGNLDGGDKEVIERVIVKMGLSLQVQRTTLMKKDNEEIGNEAGGEVSNVMDGEGKSDKFEGIINGGKKYDYKVFYADTNLDRKLEVKDFVGHFKSRYSEIQRILMGRSELKDSLLSINKIAGDRQSLSIIGIVTEKRITKNRNLIIKFEDLTGEANVLVKHDSEIFDKASELQLDDVVGVRASGNNDLLFAHDIIYPDCLKQEKVRFKEDYNVAFLSDIHCGSKKHLGKNFERFLTWIKSEDEIAKKIKYLFFVGDNVDGVGIFPGQEETLELKSMGKQYDQLVEYLRAIPKRITMFMCPGQHDATRVAEPQPIISRKYAPGLYEIENLVLVSNPSVIKLIEGEKEIKVLMYHGASIHSFINEIKELRDMKAHQCPAKAVCHMLKRRHLAPMHGDVVYIPGADKDPMVISEVPDVLCTGEVHKLDVENYNGVLIITGSCWQAKTDFEEKVGNEPDPCKVPVLNLKTRELKVFDFSGEEDKDDG